MLWTEAELQRQGAAMYGWARDLFPINRSLTGDGVRATLAYLSELLPGLSIHSVSSRSQAFNWEVPDEWIIRDAFIADQSGKRLVDFRESNLHVLGYSIPVDRWMSRQELDPHLHSLPDYPDAIPYLTSYYRPAWGFCLTQQQRDALPDGPLHVVIDSVLFPGVLNFGDLVIPGDTAEEILLSTYICHPSMANNELSGPVVACALARWLRALPCRRYTYRLVFVPETIGAIVYISQHLDRLRNNVKAGYVLTCLGDERTYSFLPSRRGNTLADRAARAALAEIAPGFKEYSYLERGSDERQYCSPGVDLPVASMMRSKYGCYPEYHTSLDNLDLISPTGLAGGLAAVQRALLAIERNRVYRAVHLCEPQLGRTGLYPHLSQRDVSPKTMDILNILAYADGTTDSIDLARQIDMPVTACMDLCELLAEKHLLEPVIT